ncbi:M48 family metallopeptidase [Lysobacter sp. N42]|uniref:M48 family metallopeptidase n=1 Tax=Lysobacter sp. N42 TaxID=2545719 RepID=UPI0010462B8B|nr:SprT family zinc-dependent metalloprotease [Lysobacter sp. N42]TCZ81574.1 M48 family peptidase [Lysobacter sp. N42]
MFNFRARTPRLATPVAKQAVLPVALPDGRVVDVLRVHHASARGLRLSVTERGARLTCPPRTSDRRALAFAQEHAAWLAGQLAHTFGAAEPLALGRTASLPLRGEALPLHWREGRYVRVERDGAGIAIWHPANVRESAVRKALGDFYLAEARADVGRWLPKYLPGLPRAPRDVVIRPLTSLWGSLAPDDRMRLDLALVLVRPSAFEYVLVHELCHLIQPNHSRAFWAEVEARFPDWDAERELLRAKGRPIKAMLRALVAVPPRVATAPSR